MIPSFRKADQGLINYHFEVEIYFNTFEEFAPYSHIEKFESDNLLEARERAFQRYEILLSMVQKQGRFFLPFASRENFVKGENASYLAQIYLIEEIRGEIDEIYIIRGGDEKTTLEALQSEKEIFVRLSVSQN